MDIVIKPLRLMSLSEQIFAVGEVQWTNQYGDWIVFNPYDSEITLEVRDWYDQQNLNRCMRFEDCCWCPFKIFNVEFKIKIKHWEDLSNQYSRLNSVD